MPTRDLEEREPRAPFTRRGLKRATLCLVTLVVALGLCELAVRALGTAPEFFHVQEGRFRLSENPLIGYELVPHFESEHSGEMRDFTDRGNSLGFRDREHAVAKPAGNYRVLVLGDSIVQGYRINDREDMFTSVLERYLTATGVTAEVLNFGVNGYNTRQEVETLREKGLEYEPDLVVVAYCVNDMDLDSGGIQRDLERIGAQRPAWKPPRALFRSALFRQVWGVVLASSRKPLPYQPVPGERSDTLVAEAFEDLAELSGRHGFEVLVATLPFLENLARGHDPAFFSDIEALARRNGFHMLDLSPALAKAAQTQQIHFDDLHPNRAGSKTVGEALGAHIRAEIPCSTRPSR